MLSFKETCLYFAVMNLCGNFVSMNPYSAALASPVFLVVLIITIVCAVLVDICVAVKNIF